MGGCSSMFDISMHSKLSTTVPNASDAWRRFGKQRRREILEADEDNANFQIHGGCNIANYGRVAQKVSASATTFFHGRTEERYLHGSQDLGCPAPTLYPMKDWSEKRTYITALFGTAVVGVTLK